MHTITIYKVIGYGNFLFPISNGMDRTKKIDKLFFGIVLALVLGGFFVFVSAAIGLLAREGARFESVLASQVFLGLIGGSVALWFFSRVHYSFLRKYAFLIFGLSLVATAAVFIPGIGFEHGGATRWLFLGPISFQPSEFLKVGALIGLAGWFAGPRVRADSLSRGFLPFLAIVGLSGTLLLLQPDMGTFIVLVASLLGVFISAGGKWRHVFVFFLLGVMVAFAYTSIKPHALDRVLTFIDPARDPAGSSWQIQQSLIAVGSGGVFGRGFGQSVQKFGFLPEPIGDSIFAVASEEFGFVGASTLIILFIFFLARGLSIARRAPDPFSGLLALGIVIMIVSQAFLNIGAILGVLPLTGVPLLFVSHGGSALFFALLSVGIVLNISRHARKT